MKKNKKIGLAIVAGLVFSFILAGCEGGDKVVAAPTIEWEGTKAASISIPRELFGDLPPDSIAKQLHVYLAKDTSGQSILGDYTMDRGKIVFKPVVPFTKGLNYEVRLGNKVIAEVAIPAESSSDYPEVAAIFPHIDTLPSNLLKIHIRFSKPMRGGQITQYTRFVEMRQRTSEDSPSIFADLGTELWNSDKTILTLWLDPGRIKRDLQPNRAFGTPLKEGMTYHLIIRSGLTDADGLDVKDNGMRDFMIGPRDTISPDIERWTFHLPKTSTIDSLKIDLHETLDYVLLKTCARVTDASGNVLSGNMEVINRETGLCFIPSATWKPGEYILECESRLEDLAGNNLNRLFDEDLTNKDRRAEKPIYRRSFQIK